MKRWVLCVLTMIDEEEIELLSGGHVGKTLVDVRVQVERNLAFLRVVFLPL